MLETTCMIDFSQIKTGQISPEKFLDLWEKHGFFFLSNLSDIVQPSAFKALQEVSESFFAQSVEDKMQYYIGDSVNHRGYVPITEIGNYSDEKERVYEAFDIGFDADISSKGWDLKGPNIYPNYPQNMKQVLRAYYQSMFYIGKTILNLIANYYGITVNEIEKNLQAPAAQLRLIHYLKNDILLSNDDVSMGAHTDYELFTIIYQSSPGLMSFSKSEREWKNIPVYKNTLLVMGGDILEHLTSGKISSLLHRVVSTGEERYSFPFFMNFDFESEISSFDGANCEKIKVGEHLLGQLYRDFPYIKNRIDSKLWDIDFTIPSSNKFEKI